jgi:hypothetical protein
LAVSPEVKAELLRLAPEVYTGLAAQLAILSTPESS